MRPRASITGLGASGPATEDTRSIPEMVLAAVEAAVSDARASFADIDAVVSASVDLHDGLTASNIAITEVAGAVMKPETRIAGDGLAALVHGACLVWAGAYETVLVTAHGKASMARQDLLSEWAMDPVLLQPLGVGFLGCSGLQAQLLATPGSERRWAERAAVLRGRDVADVLASPFIAHPIRALMKAPNADAAFAVVLQANRPGPTVASAGFDLDAHSPGDRDLRTWSGLARAFERAGGHSGGPFDVVADSCRFPHEEELFAAATGLAPTGGLFGGDAPIAAGLGQLVVAARALRTDPGRALVHGAWGPAGQAHVIAVLEEAA